MIEKLWFRRDFLAAAGAAAVAGEVPSAVLDTDTYNEIDDQFAVAYAVLSPEAMKLEAIYAAPFLNRRSSGPGDGMERSYEEILRVLDRLGKRGAYTVKRGSKTFMPAPGKPVESEAARDLIDKALAKRQGKLYVLTVGAPTNVSSAILMEPKIKDRIVVVWLGGQPYESDSAREFNLQQDPPASRVLYDSGVELVDIPTKNISEQLRTTTAELERFIKGKTKIGDYLYEIFVEHAKENKRDFSQPWSKVIWDISAVAYLINPGWVETRTVPSPILTDELTWRQAPGRHTVKVTTHINRDAIFGDLFGKLNRAR